MNILETLVPTTNYYCKIFILSTLNKYIIIIIVPQKCTQCYFNPGYCISLNIFHVQLKT